MNSFFISFYNWAEIIIKWNLFFTFCNVFILNSEANFVFYCLLSLNTHHFLNSLSYIKGLYIFPKFAGLYLSIVKQILYEEFHETCWSILDSLAFFQLFNDVFHKFEFSLRHRNLFTNNLFDLIIQSTFLNILSNKRIKRISQLVRSCCVNDRQYFVMLFQLIKQDALGNVTCCNHYSWRVFRFVMSHS